MLTREWLEARRVELQLQIAVNQGAVQMIDLALAEMNNAPEAGNNGSLTVDQFAEMVAGPGAKAEIHEA